MDEWSIDDEIPEGPPTPLPTPAPESVEGEGGAYRIVGRLGQGGAGEVFRAVDPLGRQVALKFLTRLDDPSRVERFLREGRIAASLRHPNIVAIHEAGVSHGRPFLAYELVEGGGSFDEAFRQLELEARLDLFLQVCDGVAFAHRQGVVHRDLKPDNILLGEDCRPRVADFGLGLAEADQRLTVSGALVGTPRYMSPEQAQGKGDEHGPASDVWSLGVILYEGLTGDTPFPASNLAELLAKITKASPPPPRRFDRSIPPAVERVCLRALSANPADRYSDAGELARALIAVRRGGRRSRPLVLAAVVAGLGAAIGGVIGLGQARGPTTPAEPDPTAAKRPPLAPALAAVERYRKARRWRLALAEVNALFAHYPESAEVWLARADIHATRGHWKEALVDYARATELDPSSCSAYVGRGISKAQLGDLSAGLADLDRAVGLAPRHADAREKRSLIHYMRHDYAACLADAQRAVELDPASAEAKNMRGLARAARKDFKGAILDLEEAVALDRAPTILSNLGATLLQDGQVDKGLHFLEEAAGLDPENHATWNALGVAALRAGRIERAVKSFTRALKLKPDYPESLYARAVALRRLGRPQEAITDLRHLLETHPEHPQARAARTLLQRIQTP